MKTKFLLLLAIVIFSCNNNDTVLNNDDSLNGVTAPDSGNIHPNGLNEGAPISIDTGAYKVGDSIHVDTPR